MEVGDDLTCLMCGRLACELLQHAEERGEVSIALASSHHANGIVEVVYNSVMPSFKGDWQKA